MSVVVVGLHERNTPLELLELVSVAEDDIAKVLTGLTASAHLSEVVVLSTCLRTEVYAVVERFHPGLADIESFFESRSNGMLGADHPLAALAESQAIPAFPAPEHSDVPPPRLYWSIDDEAAGHLFTVAAGIDSAVLGEGEVLHQVRRAIELARGEQASGPVLEGMFRHALEVGKRARSETAIARGTTSLSHAAAALAAEHVGDSLAECNVLVLGAGEMGRGVVRSMQRLPGQPSVVVTSRTQARAEAVAGELGSKAIPLTALDESLEGADVLVTCTTAPGVVIEAAAIESVMRRRPERPLTIVDLAVPRDVDPAAGGTPGVKLLDINDISAYAGQQLGAKAAEIDAVRQIVAEEVERYRSVSAARTVAPLVSALRERAEVVRRAELERRTRFVRSLDEAGREDLEALTRAIIAKLVHDPTTVLKESAGTPRGERLAEALRALFDL